MTTQNKHVGRYTESGYYREDADQDTSTTILPSDSTEEGNAGPVIAAICFLCGLVGAVWFTFFAFGMLLADTMP